MQLSPQEVQVVKAIRELKDGTVELYVRDGAPRSYTTHRDLRQEAVKPLAEPVTVRCEEKGVHA